MPNKSNALRAKNRNQRHRTDCNADTMLISKLSNPLKDIAENNETNAKNEIEAINKKSDNAAILLLG